MDTITLTFSSLGIEVLDGIPEFVGITTNLSSMIFYTLDSTLPTMLSTQYTSPVLMPTDGGSVTLSAIAYFLDGYNNLVPSSVMTQTYQIDSSITGERVRRLDFAGVVYIYPGGLDIPFWYDSSGDPKVFIDIPKEELELSMIVSESEPDGSRRYDVPGGVVDLVPPDETPTTRDNVYNLYSAPEDDPNFDPNALLIVIDGRNPRALDTVALINGPHMSLRDPESNYGGIDFYSTGETNYRSGSLVKMHYDRKKEIAVFYYFDSNTGRWIKSIQNLPKMDKAKVPPNAVISNPVVFEWNNFGRYQAV